MSNPEPSALPPIRVSFAEVFGNAAGSEPFFDKSEWLEPVSFFVGRNGSGKSRTAQLVADRLAGRRLSTDRLAGLTTYTNYGWTSVPRMADYRGVPLGNNERVQARDVSRASGSGIDEMYTLKEQPEVWLKVAAFLRRALGRHIELKETAGFLDPFVRLGDTEYSLLRDEGHGLRELIILLTAIYRTDWQLLVVDEPELHLHPSMARLWLSELERTCTGTSRRAIVVTHQPALLKPTKCDDLKSIWYFTAQRPATMIADHVDPAAYDRVTASLKSNPELVSQLVFSPRPVLVEGIHDVAALTTALARTQPPEVVAQTDLIECGGDGFVAMWFEIASSLGTDVRAVGDLDACLADEVRRVMDRSNAVTKRYRTEMFVDPARTTEVLKPLMTAMSQSGVDSSPKERAKWLANPPPGTGHEHRIQKIVKIWKDAGFWLHESGTLEDVLGVSAKGKEISIEAASRPGAIDEVASWCSYKLDTLGEVKNLLAVAAERIAHQIMEALRDAPTTEFSAPAAGPNSSDARLIKITPLGDGVHRLTVTKPDEFYGYWFDFSRETPSSRLALQKPASEAPE